MPSVGNDGESSSRGESLGGDMERLLGVPSMKSGMVPSGSCQACGRRGQHGRVLTVSCARCGSIFCNLACSGKHECPKAGLLGSIKPAAKKNSKNKNL